MTKKTKPGAARPPSRQALHDRKQRVIWRTFGLCNKCGKPKDAAHTSAYCGRNRERRLLHVRAAMKRYRTRKALQKATKETKG